MLTTLQVNNLLSFGADSKPLTLGPLNVLIGPNGSGKSNLLAVLRLLRALPMTRTDRSGRGNALTEELRRGGGIREWLWKGDPERPGSVSIVVDLPSGPLRYSMALAAAQHTYELLDEKLERAASIKDGEALTYRTLFSSETPSKGAKYDRHTSRLMIESDFNRDENPLLGELPDWLGSIKSYDCLPLGRYSAIRQPQPADLPNHSLLEDGLNLGLVLNRIRKTPAAKNALLTALNDLFDGIVDYDVSIEGGTVQVFLQEGQFVIPASRLSDGTLRWLCLLAVLLNPATTGLVCLEEPELGLHPDLLPRLARLLRAASERCQIVMTTHSDVLVDALSDSPESILVCEKHEGRTQLRRLDGDQLKEWLEKYTLGQLWRSGDLGGNRW